MNKTNILLSSSKLSLWLLSRKPSHVIDLSPLFSEQRGEQSRAEQDGAGAREEDPGEHPPARPEAPHRWRPQHLELYTGEPCQAIFTFTDIWQLTENDNAASIDFVWET